VSELEKTITLDKSGWLALARLRPASLSQGEAGVCHTARFNVTVAGKPAGSAEDARYFLQWIERTGRSCRTATASPARSAKAESRRRSIVRGSTIKASLIERSDDGYSEHPKPGRQHGERARHR